MSNVNNATATSAETGENYTAFVRRQFRKSTFGMISVYTVLIIALVAILADVLANDKPIVCSLRGDIYSPVLREYGVTLGLTQWGQEFATADWRALPYDWAVWPPVPYAPRSTDKKDRKSVV